MRYSRFFLFLAIIFLGLNAGHVPSSASADKPKSKRTKPEGSQEKYFKKWLDEDVPYIISEDEKSVFKALKNEEERQNFIEDFWLRRNPDPRSSNNTFREEHYRRIIYANEHFASGIPGWKTDRGRIYITWGPPDENESHPAGGQYNRTFNEGGGSTSTFPFEKWWYRHIEGVGDDIELEFVDSSMSGEYRLAMNADEKDALINVPGVGMTLAEEMGLAEKRDRAYFNPSAWYDPENPQHSGRRTKDAPFDKMEQYFAVQRPPKIKFEDLKSKVTTSVSFSNLPYDLRIDYVRLSADKVLVPITIELSNKDLEFKKDRELNRATAEVYGIVTGLTGRVAAEWEDTITKEFSDQHFQYGKDKRSSSQKMIALPPGQRYKLDLVIKDVNSKKVGVISQGLVVPKYDETTLQSSTIILADSIMQAPPTSNQLEQYIIGDMRIVPKVKREYLPNQSLLPYMQIYNMGIDQTNEKPSLDVSFAIKKDGKIVEEFKSSANNSEQFYYGLRIVLVAKLPLKGYAPGKYMLEVKVLDNISNKTVTTSTDFTVKDPKPVISTTKP
jgi:GWxTD domain-containing protein